VGLRLVFLVVVVLKQKKGVRSALVVMLVKQGRVTMVHVKRVQLAGIVQVVWILLHVKLVPLVFIPMVAVPSVKNATPVKQGRVTMVNVKRVQLASIVPIVWKMLLLVKIVQLVFIKS
jgi:hypothetical protein